MNTVTDNFAKMEFPDVKFGTDAGINLVLKVVPAPSWTC